MLDPYLDSRLINSAAELKDHLKELIARMSGYRERGKLLPDDAEALDDAIALIAYLEADE